jgi:hypothetical protein
MPLPLNSRERFLQARQRHARQEAGGAAKYEAVTLEDVKRVLAEDKFVLSAVV